MVFMGSYTLKGPCSTGWSENGVYKMKCIWQKVGALKKLCTGLAQQFINIVKHNLDCMKWISNFSTSNAIFLNLWIGSNFVVCFLQLKAREKVDNNKISYWSLVNLGLCDKAKERERERAKLNQVQLHWKTIIYVIELISPELTLVHGFLWPVQDVLVVSPIPLFFPQTGDGPHEFFSWAAYSQD